MGKSFPIEIEGTKERKRVCLFLNLEEIMKYAVVYKSLTGNTELLAEAVRSELGDACVYFGEPDAKALDADVIFLGFWTDKGTCEESLKSFLGALHGKRVELFGTAGFGKDSSYYEKILEAVKAEVPKGNLVGAGYMCQGKMGQRVRKKYEEMLKEDPENRTAQMLIENFDQASSHPDDKDVENLVNWVKACR